MPDQYPALLPMLAPGRHRSPRRGACLMELVSLLAGERWSDRPRSTHPLLAALARGVNDATSDGARPRLAALAPGLVDLTAPDPVWDVEIALRAAGAALPVAAAGNQNALAVGVLTSEQALDLLGDRAGVGLRPASRAALESAPASERWARRYLGDRRITLPRYASHAAPAIVRLSVSSIAEACVPDADERLAALLAGAIDECRTWAGLEPIPPTALDPDLWLGVCRPAPIVG